MMSLGSPISPQVTADAEGMEIAQSIGLERAQDHFHFLDHSGTLVARNPEQNQSHDAHKEHYTREPPVWTAWVPPKGRVRWAYAALISLLLVAVIVTPVAINEQLKKAKQEASSASKPLLTQTYTTLTLPTNTTRIFRDPFNTTGVYKATLGDDRRGNDIFATLEYTIEACLVACDKYNEFLGAGPSPCVAGTMNYNQEESATGQRGANCFLKTRVGSDVDRTNALALGFRLCRNGNCSFDV